jgi:hypothetical protein
MTDRRTFLKGGAALIGAGALASYYEPGPVGPPPTTTTTTTEPPTTTTEPPTTTTTEPPPTTTTTPSGDRVFSGDVNLPSGFTIPAGETWMFDPDVSTTVRVRANALVEGTLRMRPASPDVVHRLLFEGVNESAFVGGGMGPVASDVGIWVMGAGRLDLEGTPKTGWTRATAGVAAGATAVTVQDATGWRVGDTVSIAPTALADYEGFDVRTITALNGQTATLTTPTARAHPSVQANGKTYLPEVFNLTRNVAIQGSPTTSRGAANPGRTHVFVRNTTPAIHSLRYAELRYMGPRQTSGALGEIVSGRYGLHFHHCHGNARGSLVEGVVIRDCGSHFFVPHLTHGITFRDCIGYGWGTESVYWWDFPPEPCLYGVKPPCKEPSDDNLYEHCAAAWIPGHDQHYGLTGFSLQHGERNAIRDSVAVGVGGSVNSSGFVWPEHVIEALWGFDDNVAHNNTTHGIFWWQVDDFPHVVTRFDAYRNGLTGIKHGAYRTTAHYRDVRCYQNGERFSDDQVHGHGEISLISNSAGYTPETQLSFEDVWLDGGGTAPACLHIFFKVGTDHARTVLRRFHLRNWRDAPIIIDDDGEDSVNDGWSAIDIVDWFVGDEERELQPSDFVLWTMDHRSDIRVQRRDRTAFRLSGPNATMTEIPPFA